MNIPPEIITHILLLTDKGSRIACSEVCRSWYGILIQNKSTLRELSESYLTGDIFSIVRYPYSESGFLIGCRQGHLSLVKLIIHNKKCDLDSGLKYAIIGDQLEIYKYIKNQMWFWNKSTKIIDFNFACRCGSLKVANFLLIKRKFSIDNGLDIAYDNHNFDFLKKLNLCYLYRYFILKRAVEDQNRDMVYYFMHNFRYPGHILEWIDKLL